MEVGQRLIRGLSEDDCRRDLNQLSSRFNMRTTTQGKVVMSGTFYGNLSAGSVCSRRAIGGGTVMRQVVQLAYVTLHYDRLQAGILVNTEVDEEYMTYILQFDDPAAPAPAPTSAPAPAPTPDDPPVQFVAGDQVCGPEVSRSPSTG